MKSIEFIFNQKTLGIQHSIFIENPKTKEKVVAEGLYDTGSVCSVINKSMFNKIKLSAHTKTSVNTVNGIGTSEKTFVNLFLADDITFENIEVLTGDIPDKNVDFLIGMDIISQGDFQLLKVNDNYVFKFSV